MQYFIRTADRALGPPFLQIDFLLLFFRENLCLHIFSSPGLWLFYISILHMFRVKFKLRFNDLWSRIWWLKTRPWPVLACHFTMSFLIVLTFSFCLCITVLHIYWCVWVFRICITRFDSLNDVLLLSKPTSNPSFSCQGEPGVKGDKVSYIQNKPKLLLITKKTKTNLNSRFWDV